MVARVGRRSVQKMCEKSKVHAGKSSGPVGFRRGARPPAPLALRVQVRAAGLACSPRRKNPVSGEREREGSRRSAQAFAWKERQLVSEGLAGGRNPNAEILNGATGRRNKSCPLSELTSSHRWASSRRHNCCPKSLRFISRRGAPGVETRDGRFRSPH